MTLDSENASRGSFFDAENNNPERRGGQAHNIHGGGKRLLQALQAEKLAAPHINYYKEDLTYFHGKTAVKYMDEITQEVFETFILNELEAGKKQTSLNTRIRGLRVFFSFCAEREYMKPVTLKLMKVDEEIKEP